MAETTPAGCRYKSRYMLVFLPLSNLLIRLSHQERMFENIDIRAIR